jgi:hypothetical protein
MVFTDSSAYSVQYEIIIPRNISAGVNTIYLYVLCVLYFRFNTLSSEEAQIACKYNTRSKLLT